MEEGITHMIKHERTNVYDFNFHLVWVTKYRKQVFTTDKRVADMKAILKDIAKRNSVEISSMEVMPDHVHMMISFAPKFTPSSIVKAFKGGSAKQWFTQYPETKQQLWGAFMVTKLLYEYVRQCFKRSCIKVYQFTIRTLQRWSPKTLIHLVTKVTSFLNWRHL